MSGASKIIKNRIKSVSSARNITKAMELVAATKIKRAVSILLASREYAKHARELLENLSREVNLRHPLLLNSTNKKELLIVIASNRGLCGSYNTNVVRVATQYIKKNWEKKIDIVSVGRRAEIISRVSNSRVVASFIKFPDDIHTDDISPLSKMIIDEFTQKKYSKILIAFTDYISGIKHEAKVSSLLPITKENLAEIVGLEGDISGAKKTRPIILFESDEAMVLDLILPRLTEVRIYQALLESNASEHSARMMAMRTATDSAKTMIEELSLCYNQTRQAGITQAIAEISGGTEALTNAS